MALLLMYVMHTYPQPRLWRKVKQSLGCFRRHRRAAGGAVSGLYGGLFVSRAQAVKYALFENGHRPETIVELAREIELDMGGAPAVSSADAVRRVA